MDEAEELWCMKNIAFFSLLINTLIFQPHTGDAKPGNEGPRKHRSVRNVIWFHPNRARVINGLAVGPFHFQTFRDDSSLTVNGLNLELPGFAIFPLPVPESYIRVNGVDCSPFRYGGTTHGLSLGLMSSGYANRGCTLGAFNYIMDTSSGFQAGMVSGCRTLQGLQIGIFSFAGSGSGAMIGGWLCKTDSMKGFTFAAFNESEKHWGLQLGVLNYAKELRGLQFGLINIAPNCRRKVMPLMQVSGRRG